LISAGSNINIVFNENFSPTLGAVLLADNTTSGGAWIDGYTCNKELTSPPGESSMTMTWLVLKSLPVNWMPGTLKSSVDGNGAGGVAADWTAEAAAALLPSCGGMDGG
jgi:hypothetical protein